MNHDYLTDELVMIGLYMLKYASISMFKIAAAAILPPPLFNVITQKCNLEVLRIPKM